MNNLKKLRKEHHLTLRELGEKTNISFTTIGVMEKEQRPFTQSNLETLCNFFNVSADYMLGKTDVKNPSTKLAFYDQTDELTDAQKNEVRQFIEFIKKRDGA